MRTLCYNSEFGPKLFDLLNPVDLRSLQFAFGIKLTKKQLDKYMLVWRQIFVSDEFLKYLEWRGFWVMFTGPYLDSVVKMIRDPRTDERPNEPMYMDMVLCKSMNANVVNYQSVNVKPIMLMQNIEVLKELKYHHNFKDSIRYGVSFEFKHMLKRTFAKYDDYEWSGTGPVNMKVAVLSTLTHQSIPTDPNAPPGLGGGLRMCALQSMETGWPTKTPMYIDIHGDNYTSAERCLSVKLKSHMLVKKSMSAYAGTPVLVKIDSISEMANCVYDYIPMVE